MPNRIVGVLESYDFFGKSIPGIVLLIGLATLLPHIPLLPIGQNSNNISFTVLTAVALTLVFSGLVLGQAVHSIAVNIEKSFYRIGHWTINQYYLHAPIVFTDGFGEEHPKVEASFEYCHPWLVRRYWGIHDTFKSHRRLFENELGWYFDISVDKRKSDVSNVNYDTFREKVKAEYGVDIARFDQTFESRLLIGEYEQFRNLYPMITSKTAGARGRSTGFQARYSFCRGMWVVLLLLLTAYSGTLFFPPPLSVLQYQPVILNIFTPPQLGLLMWGMLVALVVFLDAAGDYKHHYIEYLIADFNSNVQYKNNEERNKQQAGKGQDERDEE